VKEERWDRKHGKGLLPLLHYFHYYKTILLRITTITHPPNLERWDRKHGKGKTGKGHWRLVYLGEEKGKK
jgi:hypothetical protein